MNEIGTEQEVLEEITKLVREYKGDDSIMVTKDSSLRTGLGLASLDRISLLSDLEDRFGVHIPDKALTEAQNVGDIITYTLQGRK